MARTHHVVTQFPSSFVSFYSCSQPLGAKLSRSPQMERSLIPTHQKRTESVGMNTLTILAIRVLYLQETSSELAVILELMVVWDNGALIESQAVLVSIEPKRRLRAKSHNSPWQLKQFT